VALRGIATAELYNPVSGTFSFTTGNLNFERGALYRDVVAEWDGPHWLPGSTAPAPATNPNLCEARRSTIRSYIRSF